MKPILSGRRAHRPDCVYHTDPECHGFQNIDMAREATEEEIERLEECAICSGDHQFGDFGDRHDQLIEADPENHP